MAPRQIERDLERRGLVAARFEAHPAGVVLDCLGADRGVGRGAVHEHRLGHEWQDLADVLIVGAEHRAAIERQVLQELHERLSQAREVMLIGIHVIGIDVRDHRNHRLQVQKGGVRFVRLDDDEIAAAEPRVRTGGSQAAADHESGIKPALRKHARHEAGGGRLAVRPGNGHALL